MEQIQQNKNILWVDIAKFIAMFLVVFEHVVLAFKLDSTEYIGYIRHIVVTFHMPLFFILGGYLYKERSKFDNYNKILFSLVIPYFIYQFLYLPLKLGYYIGYEHIPAGIAALKCLVGILLGDNLGTEGSKYALSVCPACWFIMVMIQLRFIFAHINITPKKLLFLSVLSFVTLLWLNIKHIDLYFCLDNTLYAIPYFSLGYCLKNYINFTDIVQRKTCYLWSVIFCILLSVCYLLNQNYHSIITLYACGVMGSFLVITIANLWSRTNKFVNLIAKNTLFLIFFQSLFLFITKWVKLPNIIQCIPNILVQFLFVLLYSGLIYIVSYFVILLIKKLNLNIILGKSARRLV